jgi:excisionase family DNA binding protein
MPTTITAPTEEKEDTKKLFTVSEVAELLRVDDTTVRRWIKQGALEAVVLPVRPGGTRQAYRIRWVTLYGEGGLLA